MLWTYALVPLIWLLCTACPVGAQSGDAVRLELETSIGADQDLQGSEASVRRMGTTLRAAWRDWRLTYHNDAFSWDCAQDLGWDTGTPWQALHTVGVHWTKRGRLSRRWGWFARAGATAAFEHEPGRSGRAEGGGGVTYSPSPQWRLSLGAGLAAHPVRWRALPLAGVHWRPGAPSGWSARLGIPETAVTHRWENGLWAGADLQAHNRLTRLADDSDVQPGGYLKIEDWSVGPVCGWDPEGPWRLRATPRYHFGREYTVFGPHGDKKSTWDLDNGWSVRFGLDYTLGWQG